MKTLRTPMEILRLLDGSNCKKCGEATCVAFAAAVFRGQKGLDLCPHLTPEVLDQLGARVEKRVALDRDFTDALTALKEQIRNIDLSGAADRLGAEFNGNVLTLRVMGKDFRVSAHGEISSDIHVNPWIAIPVLDYIINGAGTEPSGKWVPFRELEGGKTWHPLFGQRCEKPLKQVADTYTDLFEDMIKIFNGRQVEKHYVSDISIVLQPLPRFPILICYWKPDGGLESDLHLFFDASAENNLSTQSIYTLGAGLATMFEKIAQTHEG